MKNKMLTHSDILRLKRWNTPSIYNGWEQVTSRNSATECFSIEECHDFMPQMGPMVGYAATVVIEPSEKKHLSVENAVADYRRYIAELPGPTVVIVQDLDKPVSVGSTWGEVNANVHKALGCVGTITDGAIRDVDEMCNAGFKAIARRLCVGHAYATPVRWGCKIEAFGTVIEPGQLVHADKHGFLLIPDEDQVKLLKAVHYMDSLECDTMIKAARSAYGKTTNIILDELKAASKTFSNKVAEKFYGRGEW